MLRDQTSESLPTRSAFNKKFPNVVARDARLSPAALVLIAYRSTFIGQFKLLPDRLGRLVTTGLGKNAATAAIAQIVSAGHLRRWQPPSGTCGRFCGAVEVLSLPACGASGGAGHIVQRAWFDGSLDVKAMAALIYLRAGTGKRGPTYRRELEERFDWSRSTANKVIKALTGRGLLDKITTRRANGTIKSVTYTVPRLAADKLARSVCVRRNGRHADKSAPAIVKKPGNGLPGNSFAGDYTYPSSTPHGLPTGDLPHALSPERYAVRAAREPAPTISDIRLHEIAHATQNLLGWIDPTSRGPETVFEEEPTEEALEAVALAMPDDAELKARLVKATGARVAREILSPAGLYAIRWLAAGLVPDDDDEDLGAEEALSILLVAIERRIGSRPGAYLNSLALIGKRLAAERYAGWVGEHLYETRAAKTSAVPVDLAELAKADGARTLAPILTRDASSFNTFQDQQADLHRVYPHEIERIICGVLRRHMIDGKPVGSVKTWRYFESVIAEEIHQQRVAEQGLRPGDVFGAHRLKGTANASVDRN